MNTQTTIPQRLAQLRIVMQQANVDAYIVPSADFHQSEYVGSYFGSRAYITGFVGSAGTALITQTNAYLWTDGRYFIDAEQQLKGTTVTLCKMGQPGVPTIEEFLTTSLPDGSNLGMDGRVISLTDGLVYEKIITQKGGHIYHGLDLVHDIWTDCPSLSTEPAYALDEATTGCSTEEKLKIIRQKMLEVNATLHIITSLDDICWILNIRGNDILHSPLVLSYLIIGLDSVTYFIEDYKLDAQLATSLGKLGIEFAPYNSIYEYVRTLNPKECILLDPNLFNYTLFKNLPDTIRCIELRNPSTLLKASKNDVELAQTRIAHIYDGVAITRFMRWLETEMLNYDVTKPLTECGVAEKLASFREQNDSYQQPSFSSIVAYGAHGAIVHYRPTPQSDIALQPSGFLLVDSGGHYNEGTTDITRTFVLGPITEEQRIHYTTVLRGMLAIFRAQFPYGVYGHNLDILARAPFWELGLDYNHGTGHGVGHILNVHEGPAKFFWRPSGNDVPLEAGMIISDETGFYVTDSHGIRIENEVVIRKGKQTTHGQFMFIEPLTFAPIDLTAVNPALMSELDKQTLNNYHAQVREKLSPYLTSDELNWLYEKTRAI